MRDGSGTLVAPFRGDDGEAEEEKGEGGRRGHVTARAAPVGCRWRRVVCGPAGPGARWDPRVGGCGCVGRAAALGEGGRRHAGAWAAPAGAPGRRVPPRAAPRLGARAPILFFLRIF